MEIVIRHGGTEESFGFPIYSNIKGVRFRRAIGGIAYGAILLHGRGPVVAQDVEAIDFLGEWDPDSNITFTIERFIGWLVCGDDNRVEILITKDGYTWELVVWLAGFAFPVVPLARP